MTQKTIDDQLVEVPPKVTVGFSRTVQPAAYESAQAQAFIEVQFNTTDPSHEQIVEGLKEAFGIAKAQVFDELGVDYDVDPATQQVVEAVQKELGGTVVEEKRPRAARKAPANRNPKATQDDAWKALEEDLTQGPDDKGYLARFFDNREGKRNPNAPDFKAKKNSGLGENTALWLNSVPEWFDQELLDA